MDRVLIPIIYVMVAFAVLCIIYVVAPVAIPLIVVIGGLALLVWGITTFARYLEQRVHGADDAAD